MLTTAESAEVVGALRRARRKQRVASIHWVDALYQVYITGLVAIVAVVLLSGAVGDERVAPSTLVDIRAHGAAVLGTLAALAVFLGLRSGSRDRPRWSMGDGVDWSNRLCSVKKARLQPAQTHNPLPPTGCIELHYSQYSTSSRKLWKPCCPASETLIRHPIPIQSTGHPPDRKSWSRTDRGDQWTNCWERHC